MPAHRSLRQLQALARRGIAVILSTHGPDHAFLCADRVALLHGGRLLAIGTPDEVITSERLRRLYGVSVDVIVVEPPGGRRGRVCVPSLARRDG